MRKPVHDTRNRARRRTPPASTARPDPRPLELVVSQQGADLCASLEAMYERIFADPDTLRELLAESCVQHVGRLALNFGQIVNHVMHVRERVKSLEYSVSHAIARDDAIADRHIVEITLRDGRSVTLEVLCLMRLARGKIVELYESSQVLAGDEALGALATAMD
jgi:hypothetical protein